MRANKAARYIRGIINSDEENLQLKWIYAAAIVYAIYCVISDGWKTLPDSDGYVAAWDTFMNGGIDWRTPTYPFVLGSLKMIVGGSLFYWVVVCLQWGVFLLSIRYFYKLVRLFSERSSISFWMTLFYCWVPGIASWNNTILTESFAVSGSVFLFYFLINGWVKSRVSSLIVSITLLLLLCMLRPSFLYLLPLVLCFCFISFFIKGKFIVACYGFCGTLIVIGIVIFYCFCFQKSYGVFTPSGIGTLNQYCIVRQRNLLDPNVITNAALKADIEKMTLSERGDPVDPYYAEFTKLQDKYGLLEVHNAVTSSIKSNIGPFLKEAWKIAGYASNRNIFDSYVKKPVIKVKLNLLYGILAIYILYLLASMCRKRKVFYLSLLICAAGCGNLVMVFVGAQEEWTRLLLPALPLFLLMFAQLLSAVGLKVVIRKDNDFRLK